MFSNVMIPASLTMCSHEARAPRVSAGIENAAPQYTHRVSRASTSCSSGAGIFQRFILPR